MISNLSIFQVELELDQRVDSHLEIYLFIYLFQKILFLFILKGFFLRKKKQRF